MIPHFALPFRFEHGTFTTVEQDTLDEVVQNVEVLLGTIKGDRLAVPDFGINDPVFGPISTAASSAELEDVISTYEPRARVVITEGGHDALGQRDLRVAVSIVEPDRD